jgi:bifunctional NMN adenylyltransferase/nudix hydrolase
MIAEKFPTVEIHYINDCPGDDVKWSKNLDKLIGEHLLPMQTVTLYGSRDSFLRSYHGKFTVCELEATTFVSGTEVRRRVCNNYPPTADYRAGVIAATATRYPTAFQTVDIAVINVERNELLLGRKPEEKKLRFIGGFSDPKSLSLEDDAKREVCEETGIEVGDIQYVGSTIIDDPRYRGEVDKIKTAFFVARYGFGKPEGADDIAEVKWVPLNKLKKDDVEPIHHVLLDMLTTKVLANRKFQDYWNGNEIKIDGKLP